MVRNLAEAVLTGYSSERYQSEGEKYVKHFMPLLFPQHAICVLVMQIPDIESVAIWVK
jgi:hypothetical protein